MKIRNSLRSNKANASNTRTLGALEVVDVNQRSARVELLNVNLPRANEANASYIHIYTYKDIHTYMHTYMHAYMHTHMYTRMHAHTKKIIVVGMDNE